MAYVTEKKAVLGFFADLRDAMIRLAGNGIEVIGEGRMAIAGKHPIATDHVYGCLAVACRGRNGMALAHLRPSPYETLGALMNGVISADYIHPLNALEIFAGHVGDIKGLCVLGGSEEAFDCFMGLARSAGLQPPEERTYCDGFVSDEGEGIRRGGRKAKILMPDGVVYCLIPADAEGRYMGGGIRRQAIEVIEMRLPDYGR